MHPYSNQQYIILYQMNVLAGDPAALRFLDLVDISLDPLDEGRRMRTLTNHTDMHGVEMFRS